MKRRRGQFAQRNRGESAVATPQSASVQLVQIEKPIYGGAFLARAEGKAVFVPLALPGEQVRARIVESKRGYATAEADEIIRAAAERIAPSCKYFGSCGGCHYQHTDYATQLAFKQTILRETLERGGVSPTEEIAVLAAATEAQSWGYRNRIRLAFDANGNPGYRGRRSHAVIAIEECPIAAPLLVKATKMFAEVARRFLPALRPTEVSLFCNATETAMLASVFTHKARKNDDESFADFARAVTERIPELRGIELVAEGRTGERDSEPSQHTVAQWGETSIAYHAAGFDYRVAHGAFFQVNRWLVDGLVDQVVDGKKGALAWDLFAGVGLFARRLTSSFARVAAVESAPSATAALEENLHGTCGSAVRATTLDFLRRNKAGHPDLIVVDPPRAGLGAEITALLAEIGAPELVYVSCDPATLARDLRVLIASGYAIQTITLADLFPQTFHLETVVHLRRS
jgi:23S rRNA (uracil1939-C5)-methyltransferase